MADRVPYQKQRVSPFLRQLMAVSGVVMYMIGTGANIAYPGVLLQQLRLPDSAIKLTAEHESWIGSASTFLDSGQRSDDSCSFFSQYQKNHGCAVTLKGRNRKLTESGVLASKNLIHHRTASILGLALISGIVLAPFSLQHLGRQVTNQLSTLPALGGWALMVAARGPTALLISRFMQGFAMGLQAAAAPVSIAEYSSPKHRGAFLATIAFSFATGMLIAHIFGTLMYWRPAGVACGSCYALSLILISLTPETPPYLASKGLNNECRRSFRWFRGYDQNSEKELEVLIQSQMKPVQVVKSTKYQSRFERYLEIAKKPEFYKPTVIMMFMFVLFQVSGMTVVPSYTVPMMEEVTGGTIDANISMLMVDVVRFATAVLACVVVNKWNRRTVLFLGIIITVVSLFSVSILLYLRDFGYITDAYKWTPVIPTLTYIFGKTLGILPIPWAIAGEIFPLAYRSLGSGISGMFLSVMFFVVVKTAPMSFANIGIHGTFCIYGTCITVCGIFLYFLLPETRGKTLYEIECHFKGVKDNKLEPRETVRMLELEKVEGG